MLIDLMMQKLFNKKFDKNGEVAFRGKFNQELFDSIFKKDYFVKKKPPKSTGRELYNEEFLQDILKNFKTIPPEDIITTLSDYTAFATFYNYDKFLSRKSKIQELLVSGGGSNNKFIMQSLKKYFGGNVKVKKLESEFMSVDSKEAVCFALFANETISENPINIPSVTGAKKRTILGKICL
jgi:anhydro-N-acetylmuramic acid kinase